MKKSNSAKAGKKFKKFTDTFARVRVRAITQFQTRRAPARR